MTDYPKLRNDLEFIPLVHEGNHVFLVRDGVGMVRDGLGLPRELLEFLAMLDGRRDIRDIQIEWMRRSGGGLVEMDDVKVLLERLDSWYLLDSENFRDTMNSLTAEFSKLPVRPCAFSDRSYPGDANELRGMLQKIIASAQIPPTPAPTAIVAPHIDLSAGASSYAAAYSLLKSTRPDRVIVLGIGHTMDQGWFNITQKDFETPLGRVRCDKKAARRLQQAAGDAAEANDFVHKSEHSIEFQILFLQHMLPRDSFSIVPILCGGLPADPENFGRNIYLEKAGEFLEALKALITEPGIQTLIAAGVDFSHIGRKFGHATPAASLETSACAHDQALLERLVKRDAEGFWREILRVKDRYNVCGFPALSCLLEILPPSTGSILDYGIYREDATGSAVTFAAAAFTAAGKILNNQNEGQA